MAESAFIEDSNQHHCVRDFHSQKNCKGLKRNEGNLERNNADFSVSDSSHRIHFMNACLVTPSVFSCAIDCFLEISFRLFVNYILDISPNERSNIFEIFMSVVPVY